MSIVTSPKMAGAWADEGQLVRPVAEGEEISDLVPVHVGQVIGDGFEDA
ncbi:hypothetical protein H3V53_25560 [Paraburkholderia bengalensis]|uniref:Uncharacterized protein n=1 Tax=Paraburkholderia bengalensis TaxID=2747562 RepID=A0ABU8IY64_9BURK